MEKKALGRGLEALITPAPDAAGLHERIQTLKLHQIEASRFQPRQKFSQEKIQELANSIKEKGIIQPVVVRPLANDKYELIAGERRLRAAKHLGFQEVPAIIRRVADADLLEMSIIENVQREELNALEEAMAYQRLAMEFGLSQDSIAKRVGKDKSSISNLLRILNLHDKIKDCLSKDLITLGHAKALLSLADSGQQLRFCHDIIHKNLSVRQLEQITQRQSRKRSISPKARDPHMKFLEERMEHFFGTKVRIHHGKKRGQIHIDYFSPEDLERILRKLGLETH